MSRVQASLSVHLQMSNVLYVCLNPCCLCASLLYTHTQFTTCVCSGGEYLAVLRQDHRLGVDELLLGIMLGVIGLGISIAERRRAQGIGGGGTLHALHRG